MTLDPVAAAVLDDAGAAYARAEPDWNDVLERAGQRRRLSTRRSQLGALAIAVVALAVLVAGPAFGLYRPLIRFFEAKRAPEPVRIDFGRMGVIRGMLGRRKFPGLLPSAPARKIMEVAVAGKQRVLYVAPTKNGGFCWMFPNLFGSCNRRTSHWRTDEPRLGLNGVIGLGTSLFAGDILEGATRTLELEYEDGDRARVPFVWVSAPIDAGFFIFSIPKEHQHTGHRAKTLVARDAGGALLVTHKFLYSSTRYVPDQTGFPRDADLSRKRTLFDFRTPNGRHITFTVAPAPGNRLCFAYNMGGGCRSPRFNGQVPPLNLGLQGANPPLLCCEVAHSIATVELRFRDGDRVELRPIEGFLLYAFPSRHFARGHRLETVVGRNSAGKEIASKPIDVRVRGVYPCKRKIKLGYGIKICP